MPSKLGTLMKSRGAAQSISGGQMDSQIVVPSSVSVTKQTRGSLGSRPGTLGGLGGRGEQETSWRVRPRSRSRDRDMVRDFIFTQVVLSAIDGGDV